MLWDEIEIQLYFIFMKNFGKVLMHPVLSSFFFFEKEISQIFLNDEFFV